MLKLVVFLSFMISFCTAMSGQAGIALNHSAFFQGSLKKGFHFYKKQTKYSESIFYKSKTTAQPLPKAYCYNQLAFFCKVEVQLEKYSSFPIKFRLGSVPYTDYLEQK